MDISKYLVSELLKRWLENKWLKGKPLFTILKLVRLLLFYIFDVLDGILYS